VQAVQVVATRENDPLPSPLPLPDVPDASASWRALVEEPCRQAALAVPELVVLRSSFRKVVDPLVEHVQRLTAANPERVLVVVIPELVRRRWYHLLLRNHTATLLKTKLLLRAGPRVVIASTPWYLGEEPISRRRDGRASTGGDANRSRAGNA
jgi:hypothetical protein